MPRADPPRAPVHQGGGQPARCHAASGRCVGPTNPLAELSEVDASAQRVLAFVLAYADLVQRDWARFVGHRDESEDCEKWTTAEPV